MLATSLLAFGLVHIAARPGVRSGTLGLLLISAGGALGVSASAVAWTNPLSDAIFAAAALRFTTAGIYPLSTVSFWKYTAGLLGLPVSAIAV